MEVVIIQGQMAPNALKNVFFQKRIRTALDGLFLQFYTAKVVTWSNTVSSRNEILQIISNKE